MWLKVVNKINRNTVAVKAEIFQACLCSTLKACTNTIQGGLSLLSIDDDSYLSKKILNREPMRKQPFARTCEKPTEH